jgi:hypothetical protein
MHIGIMKTGEHRRKTARPTKTIPCRQVRTAFEVCIVHKNTKTWRNAYDPKNSAH